MLGRTCSVKSIGWGWETGQGGQELLKQEVLRIFLVRFVTTRIVIVVVTARIVIGVVVVMLGGIFGEGMIELFSEFGESFGEPFQAGVTLHGPAIPPAASRDLSNLRRR